MGIRNYDLYLLQNIKDLLLAFLFYYNNSSAHFPWELLAQDFQTY